MTLDLFKERLGQYLKLRVDVIVNENRSTMLSLLEKKRDRVRLSIHHMFLDAPEEVISAIAQYVRGSRKPTGKEIILRTFIHQKLSRLDGSHLVNKKKLSADGEVYQLDKLFSSVNKQYFGDRLDLQITWFGERRQEVKSRITFGQYYDHLRLIKIHRMLDDPFYPEFFVSFVIYHEMLHSVVPGYFNEKGQLRIHNSEFKKQEKAFAQYQETVAFEKKIKKIFFPT